MIKKQTLVVFVFLCTGYLGFGQSIFSNPITGTNPNLANPYITGQTVDPNLTVSGIGRGSGIGSNNANDRYNANSWDTAALDLTAYFEFTLTPNVGYEIDFISFVYTGQASGTGPVSFAFRSSLDGFTTNIGFPTATGATIGLSSGTYQNVTSIITFRFYAWGASAAGGTFSINDFTFNGSVYCTDEVNYANIQFPSTSPQIITVGNNFDVYAQVYEPTVTDTPNSQGSGISAWIGYNTTNNNPNGGAGWTWVPAFYNDTGGNNDEYKAEIGSGLSVGTYYYASRFQLNGCIYTYGGSGGIWNNDSVQLIVNDDTLDFYNLQFPEVGSITVGNIFDVFGQVYEAGLTPGVGQAPGISAWVGYSTTNSDPSTWTNWVAAGYNPSCLDCNSDQNDEYFVDIGSVIPSVGTYYYATRFKLNSGSYTYGGILADGTAGGQWDGSTYISGVLTVNPVPCSNLIISEYVEGSAENKYIEIYNPTSGSIDLSNYTLALYSNGSSTATTTSVLSGFLTSGSTIVYRNTNATIYSGSTSVLPAVNFNGNDAIALIHSGSIIDVIGQIGYDPGVEWVSGSNTTLNRTLRRNHTVLNGDFDGSNVYNPSTEWGVFPIDDVSDLGFHFSDCIPSNELQLQVLLPAPTNIICGYTYDFGNAVLNSNNDVVLRIQNLGTEDLEITDLSFLTGAHYSLVSPPGTPFSIVGNSYQDLTIRFNPSNIGIFLDTLTITNSDASESICKINLTGISVTNCDTTSVVLAAQDFELSGDTWGYTAVHPGTDFPNNWGIVSSLSSITSAESGTQFWGITDLERSGHENQTHELSFSYSGLLGESNVQFSFYYYTIALDATDSFDYEIFYDGVSQGTTNISANNDAWEQVLINIPSTVDNFDIIFYADLDAVNDQAGLDNFALTSTSINITTWNGTNWSSTPDINTVAIIDGNYNTADFTNGETSFSACSLIINDSFTLNIADGDYVEVENNLTVNGNIIIQPEGAFVQNNDLGTVDGAVLGDKTKIVVNKKTALMNNWYEYTYWSSPVEGETINDGLADATPNRRFWFNAQNYLDQCAEMNNDNTCTPGQDGIDDAAPFDWTLASGSDVMLPGVGYASTHRSDLFFGPPPGTPPYRFDYTFEGPFNNGKIEVAVYRNDSEMNDTNFNFIGNPYPSAIDVDEFFDLNAYTINPAGALDGVIYLWSQDTAPSSTTNGNQVLNFSQSDYAIINAGTGETAGGDNNGDGIVNSDDKPNRFIPSGQGFFVSASNSAIVVDAPGNPDPNVKTANVIFNNSMRMADGTSNSQFFRTSGPTKSKKEANKIWVNLTSDNGIFSQILVGYVDGATHNFDGSYYDTTRNTGKYSALYSIIQDSDNKFAIQGKAIEDINTDEVIKLGFETSINVATLYKLSIAQLEGDFLTSNPIYLKDNLLHKVHNLSESDYSFTSEVGEFNDRFEIMFRSETLSDTEALLNSNKLTIIELNDGRVQIKTNSHLIVKSVQILDILGRTLYQLKGSNATEFYSLSNLSQSTYIAKIELSDGQFITKRAIKRY